MMENKMLVRSWGKAVDGTRSVINEILQSGKDLQETKLFLSFDNHPEVDGICLCLRSFKNGDLNVLEVLGLPKNEPRQLDQPYISPPVRYILTGAEHVAFILKDFKFEPTEVPSLKRHGFIESYEVFSETLFPTDLMIVMEDSDDGVKMIKKFRITTEW